jgi:hypothetical protein
MVGPRLQQFVPNEFHAIGLLNLISEPVLILQNTRNPYRLTGVHHFILSDLSDLHIAVLRIISEKERFLEMALLRRLPYRLEVREGHALSSKRELKVGCGNSTRGVVEIYGYMLIENHRGKENQGPLGCNELNSRQIGGLFGGLGCNRSSVGRLSHFSQLGMINPERGYANQPEADLTPKSSVSDPVNVGGKIRGGGIILVGIFIAILSHYALLYRRRPCFGVPGWLVSSAIIWHGMSLLLGV